MKFSSSVTTVGGLLALLATSASAYPITGSVVNCRSGPTTSDSVVRQYVEGDEVDIVCQTEGTSVEGSTIWDKTQHDCYVADQYVKTGTDGYVTDKCGSGGGGGGGMGDDYPSDLKSSCGSVDDWNYYACQCTSFVAWRINDRLGVDFHNQYKGEHWGNANSWDDAAAASGVSVNSSPKVGSVAQSDAGSYGHVAWVSSVSGSQVTVEEYNYEVSEGYGTRTLSASSFSYIHV